MPRRTIDTPVFTVTLKEGMAVGHRLPLEHVVHLLYELEQMIRDVGRVVQRDNGIEVPTGDFGVELLATTSGMVFRKGSIKVKAAVTRDTLNGRRTMQQIIGTADALEKKKPVSVSDEAGTIIVRRLHKIGEIQQLDRTQLKLQLTTPGLKTKPSATFTEKGIETIAALDIHPVKVDSVTLFGRLRELRDRSKTEEGGKYFWGELLLDNGDIWRLRFNAGDIPQVTKLFTKQIEATGEATYFAVKFPSLRVKNIVEDEQRDYVAAFDELYGCDKDLYGDEDFDALLNEMRGEG